MVNGLLTEMLLLNIHHSDKRDAELSLPSKYPEFCSDPDQTYIIDIVMGILCVITKIADYLLWRYILKMPVC